MTDLENRDVGLQAVPRVNKLQSQIAMTASGVVLPNSLAEVAELAQYMCKAGSSIPKLMRDNPGECMGVIMDAMSWGMNPFAVARQRYIVDDKEGNQVGAYMSQLITAVVQKLAPIKEKVIAPIYEGEGPEMTCTIRVHHRDTDEVMEYTSPKLGKSVVQTDGSRIKSGPGPGYIWPKNSPLWDSDTKRQLFYYSIRAWARIHTPGIIMGVYDIEEAQQAVAEMRDITPKAQPVNLLEDPPETVAAHKVEVTNPEPRRTGWNRAAEDFAQTQEREHPREPEAEQADAETGEQQGQLDMGDKPAPLTPERIFTNLVNGARSCKTATVYAGWYQENMTAETKALIGPENWKALRAILIEVESEVGYL